MYYHELIIIIGYRSFLNPSCLLWVVVCVCPVSVPVRVTGIPGSSIRSPVRQMQSVDRSDSIIPLFFLATGSKIK